MASFGDIRAILQDGASQQTWNKLAGGLRDWYGREPVEVVIDYCKDHLSRWPADLRTLAPAGWFTRSAKQIKADPLTPLFVFALGERTTTFREEAEALLASKKANKPPKFLNLDDLGKMRWRAGGELDEAQRKQLIMVMREDATEAPGEGIMTLRQLLRDDDCHRWSKLILKAWEDDGSKSPHRWALFQVGAFGQDGVLKVNGAKLLGLHHTRARQYMGILQVFGSRDALTTITEAAVQGRDTLSATYHARDAVRSATRSAGLGSTSRFVARQTDLFARQLDALTDPKSEDKALFDGLFELMSAALPIPAWRVIQGLIEDPERAAKVAGVLWTLDGGPTFHITADGPRTRGGEAVELDEKADVYVTHTATLSDAERDAWTAHLASQSIEQPITQLAHPYCNRDKNLIPEGGLLFPSTEFFWSCGWDKGPPEDGGVIHCLIHNPTNRLWTAEASLNFGVSADEGEVYQWGEEQGQGHRITDISVRPKLNSFNAYEQTVAESEAMHLARLVFAEATNLPE